LKWGERQLRWKTRNSRWTKGLRRKGNFGGLLRGRAECLWEPNQTPTLQHLFEISNRFCFGTMHLFEEVLCEGSARRDAGEVGDVNSDGGVRI